MTKCKVCGTSFTAPMSSFFRKERDKIYSRPLKRSTCSKQCANYARGAAERTPHAKCAADNCQFFGRLVNGLCRKHFQRMRIHGFLERERRIPIPLNISEGWKMWLAAVIDCEGWIGLRKAKRNGGNGYYGGVGVGNTNVILTDKLLSLTGFGHCRLSPRRRPAKDLIQWNVHKRKHIDDLLVTIRPYLLLKRKQAELLLSLPTLHAKDNATRAIAHASLAVLNRKGRR